VLADGGAHLAGGAIDVVRDQPIEEALDGQPGLIGVRLALRLQRHVAFGVEAQGAVVEIGRADPHQLIVHDRHLGMDDDGRALRRPGAVGAEAAVTIGGAQAGDGGQPRRVHGQAVESAGAVIGADDDDMRAARLGQAPRQGFDDDGGGQVLVFDIEAAPGAGDRLQMQVQNLVGAL